MAVMMMCMLLLLPFVLGHGIPSDRIIDWSYAGIPGGIPERNTICATVAPGPASPQQTTGNMVKGSKVIIATSAADFAAGQQALFGATLLLRFFQPSLVYLAITSR